MAATARLSQSYVSVLYGTVATAQLQQAFLEVLLRRIGRRMVVNGD